NGGNFFNEAPDDFTLDATDVLEEFALEDEYFVSPLELERELINLSPLPNTDLVDGGVTTAETPTEDRSGTARDANPDIGANELLGETVVDIAVNSGIHNTLVSVLGTANLVTTLQGDGPFTVFAPTDDAFAAVPEEVLNTILANVEGCLVPTLTYHVVVNDEQGDGNGVITSPELRIGDIETATTFQGEELAFVEEDEAVSVTHFAGSSNIVLADLVAKNGVVHVLDAVMLPQAVVEGGCLTSVEDLTDSGLDLSIFPNPVVEKLEISAQDPSIGNFEMSLIDGLGRFVSTYSLGNGSHEIDMTSLPAGNYTLLFIVEGEMYSTQIVKQ
ncbi:MAG: fasciclin domain-containing protein, partial [Bacteroidota bacterium]